MDAVDEQLSFQPEVVTRNRKPLEADPKGFWELRVRHLRVFYTFEQAMDESNVFMHAIGVKVRSRILIDGREANLHEED
jgi:hypothetical protein